MTNTTIRRRLAQCLPWPVIANKSLGVLLFDTHRPIWVVCFYNDGRVVPVTAAEWHSGVYLEWQK